MNKRLFLTWACVTCLALAGQIFAADESKPPNLLIIGSSKLSLGAVRESIELEFDWRFTFDEIYNDAEAKSPLQLGPEGLEAPNYDDGAWRTVNIPHDWAIEGDYASDHPTRDNAGYVQAGIGWYRKTIDIPETWQGKRLWLEFEGVFRKSTVWVNGVKLGHRPYGWISFGYDITDAVAGQDKAVIAVRVDNSQQNAARWYTGSGIYAPVRLTVTEPVHIAPWGTFVRAEVASDSAAVLMDTEIANSGQSDETVQVRSLILDPEGQEVARDIVNMTVEADATDSIAQRIQIAEPRLWSCETPTLYTAISEIYLGQRCVDRYETRFGIRTVRWRNESGFWLNGENVKLRGVCNHQDAGPLGAAVPDKILRFRLQQLKNMGCNAIRTSHNPQTPAFYDLCDEMGILVMDEIFDGWKRKAPADYGAYDFDEWWRRDLRDWIRRDRNHPSVVIWSVGNETRRSDVPMGKWIVDLCHELDPTRLVTSGGSDSSSMDVHGENGRSEVSTFPQKHGSEIDQPFVATEYPHTWQVRGFYKTQTWYRDGYPNQKQKPSFIPDLTPDEIFFLDWTEAANKTNAKKQIFNSSYDNGTVRISARQAWQQVRDLPWWSGQFRWTGHDYLGEAGYVHGGWPFKAFMGGAIDLCNFEKDLYYLYQSQWTDKPMVHLLPHWTHPDMATGTEIPVWAYSNCDEVELFLNGESLGRDKPGTEWDEMQCEWLVPWTPDRLKAVGYRGGKAVAEAVHRTAGTPARVALTSDTPQLAVDGKDVAQVTIAQQDAEGNFYPYGENRVYFHLDGPARLRALGSGSPIDVEPHCNVNSRVTFFGLAKAYIEATREAGPITLTAAAICGEKRQITSDLVSIDVQQLALRGSSASAKFQVFYTTDGTRPTHQSVRYEHTFPVPLGTTVKAVVFVDSQRILDLEERFAENEGFYWGSKEAAAESSGESVEEGEQAEGAQLSGASHKSDQGKAFHGDGYVELPGEGAITWYIENDGEPADYDLVFRYAGKDPQGGRPMRLELNGKVVVTEMLLKNTGGWRTHWKMWTTRQRLQQGANEIRLSTLGQGGMSIDEVLVKPVERAADSTRKSKKP